MSFQSRVFVFPLFVIIIPICALLCSNCLASPRPHAPCPAPLLYYLTPCLTITDRLKVIFCYAEFLVRPPKRIRLLTSFCFCPTTILACFLFLISGFDFFDWLLDYDPGYPSLYFCQSDPRCRPTPDYWTLFCYCFLYCRISDFWLERIKAYDLSHLLVRVWLLLTPWQRHRITQCLGKIVTREYSHFHSMYGSNDQPNSLG